MSHLDDILSELKKQTVSRIILRGESIQENNIYCPFCGHEQDSHRAWELGLQPNDSEFDYQCASCEKDFIIAAVVVFSTYKKED